MEDEINTLNDWEDDSEYDFGILFDEFMHHALSPVIKRFLNEYYGELIYNLQTKTYLEIEKVIREDFIYADEIPDIFYRYCTIKDPAEFDKAFENYTPSKTPVPWPKKELWFDKELNQDDNDGSGDSFLDYTHPDDLSEEELKAKELIDLIDEMASDTRRSANFMKSGYEIIMKECQLFLEKNTPFDLSVLSHEGFLELQEQLNLMIETLLEDVGDVINGDLNGEVG